MRLAALVALLSLLTACAGTGVYVMHGNNEGRRGPLEKAAQAADVSEVKRLLASGADPNDPNGIYGSPLNAAAMRRDNSEIIRLLLAAGANPNGRGEVGASCWLPPLWAAASWGEIENTRTLLEGGASIKPSKCSRLPIGWLKPPIVELLIEHGLNLNDVDESGRNQLHLALAPPVVPSPEGIEYLVHSGVALNARDKAGKTPLAYWREPRDYENHWFTTWVFDRLGDSGTGTQRENRAKISALLERSGALP
jgi:ankyrin repeat protein